MDKLRILLVEDHGIVRAGIRSLLESQPDIEVVGEAGRGDEGYTRALELKPDLVLMDISMPGMNGIEATRRIKKELPDTNVLALTIHDDDEFFFPVLRAGASGYILKGAEPEELLGAIRQVSKGQVFLSPAVTKALLESLVTASTGSEDEKYSSLTRREKEVLRLAVAGRTNRDIAEALFLSIRTVEKHRQGMMHKLGLATRDDLGKYARRKGLLDPETDKT
ncbi:MAG: response regulator transcription factor [Dehalococcoidia bacterium]|nr:response regulator transcription factor [Dehalococcoidia bacterium]